MFDLDYYLVRPRALNVLQRRRLERGLSQDELAVEVGVARQTVSSIENRQTVPSVQLALAIATALDGTVEELFPADELVANDARVPADL